MMTTTTTTTTYTRTTTRLTYTIKLEDMPNLSDQKHDDDNQIDAITSTHKQAN